MEFRETQTAQREENLNRFAGFDHGGEPVKQRLEKLLAINAETAREKAMYASDREKLEADLMTTPLSLEKTFSYFGLMLGAFPPAALFLRIAMDGKLDGWVFGVMFIINLISAVVGFFSGKVVARAMRNLESKSWLMMILAMPFVGLLWGAAAGGAGGVVIFIFGALAGAILGGAVGGAALPVFAILHRWLKKGESIELKHFLPVAFGIVLTICGFILGL